MQESKKRGRKPAPEGSKLCSFYLDPATLSALDSLAADMAKTKSDVIRSAVARLAAWRVMEDGEKLAALRSFLD